MGCKTEERQIQGHKYVVTQMTATMSLPIQAELGTLLADVAGPLLQASKGGEEAIGEAISAVAGAIRQHLPPERFTALVTELVQSDLVRRDGECVNLDLHFSGDEGLALYPVLAFVLEVNYAAFFRASGLGEFASRAAAKVGALHAMPTAQEPTAA